MLPKAKKHLFSPLFFLSLQKGKVITWVKKIMFILFYDIFSEGLSGEYKFEKSEKQWNLDENTLLMRF